MISYMRKRSEIRAATELSQPVTRIRSNSSYLIETPIIRFILEHLRMDRYYTSCSAHKLLTELCARSRETVCGLVTRSSFSIPLCLWCRCLIPVTLVFLLSQQKICCYRKMSLLILWMCYSEGIKNKRARSSVQSEGLILWNQNEVTEE